METFEVGQAVEVKLYGRWMAGEVMTAAKIAGASEQLMVSVRVGKATRWIDLGRDASKRIRRVREKAGKLPARGPRVSKPVKRGPKADRGPVRSENVSVGLVMISRADAARAILSGLCVDNGKCASCMQ